MMALQLLVHRKLLRSNHSLINATTIYFSLITLTLTLFQGSSRMHRSIRRCTTCRVSVLDAFASLAGVSIPVSSTGRNALVHQTPKPIYVPASRHFHQLTRLNQSRTADDETSSPANSAPSSSTSSIPWYLQVEEPTPPISNLTPQDLLRQEIPPLPSNPPGVLPAILEHLSTQIGLDDLVLLDLRDMNPPPALGSNLLMIIGTARSVKHLNVSADRFCRWARKEYKLRPYADGLLGRNELKLKLRRKARRLRLAQSVGNTMVDDQADDGITTGWVCVNMGAVDDRVGVAVPAQAEPEALEGISRVANDNFGRGLEDEEEQDEEEEEEYENPPGPDLPSSSTDDGTHRYAGFGSRDAATRIVVQMFTDSKRNEMDLEGLWGVRNTRLGIKSAKADVEFGEVGFDDARDDMEPLEDIERDSLGSARPGAIDKGEMEKSWDQRAAVSADQVDRLGKRAGRA